MSSTALTSPGNPKHDIKMETDSETALNQLAREYCRLCATQYPKHDLHYFSKSDEESNKLLYIIHRMKIDIQLGDDLPQTTCKECIQILEGVDNTFTIITNAQIKLESIFKREEPIKVDPELTKASHQMKEGFNFSLSDSENEHCWEGDDEQTESANGLEVKKEETALVLLISDSDSEHDSANKTQNNIKVNTNKYNEGKTNDTKCKLLTEQRKQFIQNTASNHIANKTGNNPNDEHKNKQNTVIINETKLNLLTEQRKQFIHNNMKRPSSDIVIGSTTIKPIQSKKKLNTHPRNRSVRQYRKVSNKPTIKCDNLSLPRWSDFFCCKRCNHTAQSLQDLRQHSWSTHKLCIKFKCVKCSNLIINYKYFLKHMTRQHYANLERCCPFCSTYFDSGTELVLHIRSEHYDEQKPHMCNSCGTTFLDPEELKKHRESFFILHRKENGGITYACSKCTKVFLNKVTLECHLQEHDSTKNVCTACNKRYKTKYLLNYHMKNIHSDSIRLWYCEMCGKGFKHKTKLYEHISRHTKEFRHPCKLCEKKFASSTALKEHQVTHSGARPYACKMCEQSYRYKSGLNLHVAKKHPVLTSNPVI